MEVMDQFVPSGESPPQKKPLKVNSQQSQQDLLVHKSMSALEIQQDKILGGATSLQQLSSMPGNDSYAVRANLKGHNPLLESVSEPKFQPKAQEKQKPFINSIELFRRKKVGNADLDFILGSGKSQIKNLKVKEKRGKPKDQKSRQEAISSSNQRSEMDDIHGRDERRESMSKMRDDDEKLNFINFVVSV